MLETGCYVAILKQFTTHRSISVLTLVFASCFAANYIPLCGHGYSFWLRNYFCGMSCHLSCCSVIQSLQGWERSAVFLCASNHYFYHFKSESMVLHFLHIFGSLCTVQKQCVLKCSAASLITLYTTLSSVWSPFHTAAIFVSWDIHICITFLYTYSHTYSFAIHSNSHNGFIVKCRNEW